MKSTKMITMITRKIFFTVGICLIFHHFTHANLKQHMGKNLFSFIFGKELAKDEYQNHMQQSLQKIGIANSNSITVKKMRAFFSTGPILTSQSSCYYAYKNTIWIDEGWIDNLSIEQSTGYFDHIAYHYLHKHHEKKTFSYLLTPLLMYTFFNINKSGSFLKRISGSLIATTIVTTPFVFVESLIRYLCLEKKANQYAKKCNPDVEPLETAKIYVYY